ncbi:hypothetical protein AVEN_89445-1, partial [Araneus ventricosus]
GRGGLAVDSQPRNRRIGGSKPDSIKESRVCGAFHATSDVEGQIFSLWCMTTAQN